MKIIEISYSELRVYVNKVITIIGNNSGIDETKISLSSNIESDLKITGDDVQELLTDIDKKLSIDFKGFGFRNYFHDEADLFITGLLLSIFFKKKKENFTVGDLVTWVINRKFITRDEVYFKLI